MLMLAFPKKDMASLFGISKRTLNRRLTEFGISMSSKFSNLTNEELDSETQKIIHEFPNIGYRTVRSHLNVKSFVVQKSCVLDSMKRVDKEEKDLLKPIFRRQYNVRAPLSLWHIDGNHKLIRIERLWRDVWDGCIGLFYKLFCMMEDTGILLPQNDDHLKALHYIYLPRIQQHMDTFRSAYTRRPLRTANSRTPMQLWISGLLIDPRTNLNM
ncbi:hypothetical protein MAR_033435, partial [Mya arenaria]